jgi:hypothetical protein
MPQRFNLSQFTWHFPGKGEDFAIYAAAILAAQRLLGRHSRHEHVVDKLGALAEQLKARDGHDGLALARDWLLEFRVDPIDLEPLQKMYGAISREVDTDHVKSTLAVSQDVLEVLFVARHFGMAKSMPATIVEMLEADGEDRIGCAFPLSAGVALACAQKNEVVLFAGDPTISMVVALLSLATDAKLVTDRRDPLSGAYLGTRRTGVSNPLEDLKFEHLVSIPPYGALYEMGPGLGRKGAESIQFDAFSGRWSKTLITIVSDGFLNRTSAADVAVRRLLLERYGIDLTSLPAAIWGRSSGLQTTLLRFSPNPAANVIFVDGRSMGSQGRPSAPELARHVEELPWLHQQPERYAAAPIAAVAADQFNLSVDRYVKSALVQQMEAGLNSRPTVALGDITEIVRPQAARPLREGDDEDAFEAVEVTTSDIDEGALLTPGRLVRFAHRDAERVLKSAVRPGDVIVSVKGRVGLVGVVPDRAPTEPGALPWVISQSFAILRVKDEGAEIDSGVLGSLLSAPWAQEKLQALAGGSTVPMISMTDLRAFTLPMPDEEALDDARSGLQEIELWRQQIAVMKRGIEKKRKAVWASLWDMPISSGEDVNA